MNILFYSSFNSRARDAESLMIAFKKQGHYVVSLSQAEGKDINNILIASGIEALSYKVSTKKKIWFTFKHLAYLIRLCKNKNVDIIYCHLEPASFIGVISQFFIRSKVYLCRHHIDEAMLYDFHKSVSYRLTYALAKKIIVVSNRAKDFMVQHEGVPANKIIHINLAYNFSLFPKPNIEIANSIRQKYASDILLLTVGRLTEFKRPDLSIQLLKRLLSQNVNARLIILGNGDMSESLKQNVLNDKLNNRIIFPGHVTNVLDYMAASNFLIHPSILESSCVVVKEAALVKLPVIVCEGIGDFDEYVVNKKNGFIVDKNNFVIEATDVIQFYKNQQSKMNEISGKLHQEVNRIFNIDTVIDSYAQLNQ